MTKDRVTALISMILGAAIAVATMQLPYSAVSNDVGPRVFPFISSGLLIFCGLGLFLKNAGAPEPFFTKEQLIRLGSMLLVLLLYCIAMSLFGFTVPTTAVLYTMSTMFSSDNPIAWWKKLLYSTIITVIIYVLFREILVLKLPTSTLF